MLGQARRGSNIVRWWHRWSRGRVLLVASGGVLLFEHHIDSDREPLAGPRQRAHRLRPNELLGLLPGLRLLHYEEGLFPGSGPAPLALVRAVAQRPPHRF